MLTLAFGRSSDSQRVDRRDVGPLLGRGANGGVLLPGDRRRRRRRRDTVDFPRPRPSVHVCARVRIDDGVDDWQRRVGRGADEGRELSELGGLVVGEREVAEEENVVATGKDLGHGVTARLADAPLAVAEAADQLQDDFHEIFLHLKEKS